MNNKDLANDEAFAEYRQLFFGYLDENALSHTSERFAILREVYTIGTHFNVETLLTRLKLQKYQVSRATLYHTLDLMADCGLVRKLYFDGGPAMYECAFRVPPHDHVLLADGECIEFSDSRLDEIIASIEAEYGLKVTGHSLLLRAERS